MWATEISETRFISSFHTGSGGFYPGIQVPHKEAAEELLMTRPPQISHFWDVFLAGETFQNSQKNVCVFNLYSNPFILPNTIRWWINFVSICNAKSPEMTLDAGRLVEGRCPHIPTLPHTMGGVFEGGRGVFDWEGLSFFPSQCVIKSNCGSRHGETWRL